MNNKNVKLILTNSEFPGKKNVYVLGVNAKRVTFYSQQRRALNLIWALCESKLLKKGKKLAIVGGGLAGLTAAVAAKSKGCSVTLYEQSNILMSLQYGCYTRFVHPNIYDWPKTGSENPRTDLPFMNWYANIAASIAKGLHLEWDILGKEVEVRLNQPIDEVSITNNKPTLSSETNALSDPYDCIIFSVGFGIEKKIENIPFTSYWSNDDLHQSPLGKDNIKEYLITGCGDGGLIDAQRLLLKKFDHKDFSEFILSKDYPDLRKELLRIENKALKLDKTNDFEISQFLYDQYKGLPDVNELNEWLSNQLQPERNIQLMLNGPLKTPLNLKASILNRFIIYQLIKKNIINYKPGKIISANIVGSKINIAFEKIDGKQKIKSQKSFDKVIVRHGPEQPIKTLMSKGTNLHEPEYPDPTSTQLWPVNFFKIPKEPFEKLRQRALANFNTAYLILYDDKHVESLGITTSGNKVFYQVVLKSTAPKDYELPKEVNGIIVKHIRSTVLPSLHFLIFSGDGMQFDSDILRPGTGILFRNLGMGNTEMVSMTLGCFVETANGRKGILSTSHQLGSINSYQEGVELLSIDKKIIGHLRDYSTIEMLWKKNQEVVYNTIDASITELNDDCEFFKDIDFEGQVLSLSKTGIAECGDKVFKRGYASGLTSGKVIGVDYRVMIRFYENNVWFDKAILIESNSDNEFSLPGDSGSVVFRRDGSAVGILFAGGGRFSYMCDIREVLKKLECDLLRL